jgi:spore coat protein A
LATSCLLVVGLFKGVATQSDAIPDSLPEQIKYSTRLAIPEIVDLRSTGELNSGCGQTLIEFYMKESEQDFGIKDTDKVTPLTTKIYGYASKITNAATYPGPTIVASRNCPINITFHNTLGIGSHMFPIDRTVDCGDAAPNCTARGGSDRRATTHLHGGHTQPQYDGHPESWVTDYYSTGIRDGGKRFSATGKDASTGENLFSGYNYYHNDQEACTLFYHDHAHGITRLNVYAGLAGLYIIEDDRKTGVFADHGLPPLGDPRHIPLAFADRTFSYVQGQSAPLFYPYGIKDVDSGDLPENSILPEVFGNMMTVNGVIYPYLDVDEGGLFVFRLLNACDSRYLTLYFEVEGTGERVPFTVVASDQGLVSETETLDELLIGPAERYEIAVSFARLAGKNVTVMNSEITLLGPVVPGVDDQFMQFRVLAGAGPSVELPNWNIEYEETFWALTALSNVSAVNKYILEDFVDKREVWITEGTQILVDSNTPSGGRPLPMLGPRPNAFGLPYAADPTEILVQNKPMIWEFINLSVDKHVIHLHQVSFKVVDRQAVGLSYDTFQHPSGKYRQYVKNADLPSKYEAGPKDVFISDPGSVTRVAVKFDIAGLYVWHCHILSHEDNMMMRDLIVQNTIPFSAYAEKALKVKLHTSNAGGVGNGNNPGNNPSPTPGSTPGPTPSPASATTNSCICNATNKGQCKQQCGGACAWKNKKCQ